MMKTKRVPLQAMVWTRGRGNMNWASPVKKLCMVMKIDLASRSLKLPLYLRMEGESVSRQPMQLKIRVQIPRAMVDSAKLILFSLQYSHPIGHRQLASMVRMKGSRPQSCPVSSGVPAFSKISINCLILVILGYCIRQFNRPCMNKLIKLQTQSTPMLPKPESNHKPSQQSTYCNNDESKTFPLIPDEIHKVPESIRKAIKVGKHRKNININVNARFSNMDQNDDWVDGVKMEGRREGGLHVRQIFGLMGKATNQADQEGNYNEDDNNGKESVVSSYFKSEGQKNRISGDRILYARKKLTPLKKGLTVEPRSIMSRDKRNFKVTFLNVQKLELVKMYSTDKQRVDVSNKTAMNLAASVGSKSKLIQNFLESTGLSSNQNPVIRRSFYDKSPTKLKLKPFVPPFQRYHYRDFIWKCAFSYSIFHESPEVYEQKFKVFIGRGNNSMLVKSLLKRRKSWWAFTDRYDEANFAWTQIKINIIFSNQKNQKSIYEQKQHFCPERKPEKLLTPTNKLNLKILNQHQNCHWMQYFTKYRKAEDTLDQTMKKRNRVFVNEKNSLTCKNFTQLDLKSLRIHNHLPNNYIISNKKALFYTMCRYYQKIKEDVFQYLPLTFHIQNGLQDPEYLKFLTHYYERAKKIRAREKNQDSPPIQQQAQENQPQSPTSPSRVSVRNMWIVKPGQFTNRGNGITVCMNLQEIKAILKRKQRHDNGNYKTYIIQSYLEKPFLYQKRKFDLRHYMMITSINGVIKGYWYELGYIRTTSYQYSTKNGLTSVHLTNDAVQKYLPEYGKYQKGNKISYEQFHKYLEKEYGDQYNFYEQVYPKMKKIATDSIRACSLMIDPEKKGHNFEVFGMDFMIDGDFHPWLIQINNNPCLQLSCPLLGEIIPPMVQNCLKICLDSLIPPPASFLQKKSKLAENILQTNKFQLVYDSTTEQKQLMQLFNGNCKLDLDYKQLEKDQDEVFDDDGIELED